VLCHRADDGSLHGYIKDHIVPLACGGPDAVANLQWQTTAAPKAKDQWERNGCRARHAACLLDFFYRLAATWLKTPLRLVPTVPIMTTAATAISAAIRPYSIAVTPQLSLIRQRKNCKLRILGLSLFKD
jgi:hypothetical protein